MGQPKPLGFILWNACLHRIERQSEATDWHYCAQSHAISVVKNKAMNKIGLQSF